MNFLENFIRNLSPTWALQRENARTQLRQLDALARVGGYQAASTSSTAFQQFFTSVTDADASVDYGDRERLIEISRDHIRNIPVAVGIIKRICDHAIGDKGLACHPKIDFDFLGMSKDQAKEWQRKTAKEWRYFSESKDCDFYRKLNFNEQVYQTLQSELEGGDCFTLMLNEKKNYSPYSLNFQLVEGEQVSNPNLQSNTQKMVYGVEKDELGREKAYHFRVNHPGTNLTVDKLDWTTREIFDTSGRRRILHHYLPQRVAQTRGIPILAPVSEKILNLGTLGRAELTASVLNSFYTIMVKGDRKDTARKKTAPTSTASTSASKKQSLGSGTILDVPNGVEFQAFDPKRPNLAYKPFFDAVMGEIGCGVGVPKSLILMWFDRSYSASRGEVLLAWVYFLFMRTHIAVNKCQPSYEAWLDEAVANGIINAPGYFSSSRVRRAYCGSAYDQWVGPSMPAIDVLKEAKAEAVKINESHTKSRKQSTAEMDGQDWEETVFPQLLEENKQLMEALVQVTNTNVGGLNDGEE